MGATRKWATWEVVCRMYYRWMLQPVDNVVRRVKGVFLCIYLYISLSETLVCICLGRRGSQSERIPCGALSDWLSYEYECNNIRETIYEWHSHSGFGGHFVWQMDLGFQLCLRSFKLPSTTYPCGQTVICMLRLLDLNEAGMGGGGWRLVLNVEPMKSM